MSTRSIFFRYRFFILPIFLALILIFVYKCPIENIIKPQIRDTFQISQTLANSRFTLTYAKPENYDGPIVEGWPPNKNRNMSQYISEDSIITDECLKQKALEKIKLLILVKSAVKNKNRRRSNRKTWMKDISPEIEVLHVLGKSDVIKQEIAKFCDIVQVDVADHYMNNTLKMAAMLQILIMSKWLNPDFVLIADDDSYINIPSIYQLLFSNNSNLDFNLFGFVYSGEILRPKSGNMNKLVKPSVCPTYMYDGMSYPHFLSGAGYILPALTLPCLFTEVKLIRLFATNDPLGQTHTSTSSDHHCHFERCFVLRDFEKRGRTCGRTDTTCDT